MALRDLGVQCRSLSCDSELSNISIKQGIKALGFTSGVFHVEPCPQSVGRRSGTLLPSFSAFEVMRAMRRRQQHVVDPLTSG